MDKHLKILYACMAVVLGLVGTLVVDINKRLDAVRTMVSQPILVRAGEHRPSPTTWPGLTQNETIAFGEALKKHPKTNVTIYCSNSDCEGLMIDLDDAFQIADWPTTFERRPVDSESDLGITLGPPGGSVVKYLNFLFVSVKGYKTHEAEITGEDGKSLEGVGIILGRYPSGRIAK